MKFLELWQKEIAMQIAATNPADLSMLLEEPFIKNPDMTITKLIEEAIQKPVRE